MLRGPLHNGDPGCWLLARARVPARVALALNLLTEEGLPHFHRLLAKTEASEPAHAWLGGGHAKSA